MKSGIALAFDAISCGFRALGFRLVAANYCLVGANYGLAAAYDRLVGANEAQLRQMEGLEGGAGSVKSALDALCCAERRRD